MKADLQKHTLHLRAGDWDYVESIAKPNGLSTSLIVRTLVSNYVDQKRDEERKRGGSVPDLDVEI